MPRVLAALAALFLTIGVAGGLVHAGLLRGVAIYALVLPPSILSLPDHGPLTDAAHGPPFLTPIGIFVVYFVPAALLAAATRALAARDARRRTIADVAARS